MLFGLVGQASDYTLAKVTFTGDSAAGHASLVTIAAEALGVPTPSELGAGGELNVIAEIRGRHRYFEYSPNRP